MGDRRVHRGLRDEAGVGPDPGAAVNLVPLRDLKDYKVADGEPDIRGWNVYTSAGREIGDIDDLLVDTDTNEVVLVDVDLKRNDRHTLAPIRAAWIDRPHRRVVLNSAQLANDDDVPDFSRSDRPLDDESVSRFNERYARAYGESGYDSERDFRVRHANDELRIRRPLPPPSELSGRPVPVPAGDTGAAADTTRDRALRDREVRFPPSRGDLPEASGVVMEEVVVRRRLVDPAELDAAERERLRESAARETIENRPPTEERR